MCQHADKFSSAVRRLAEPCRSLPAGVRFSGVVWFFAAI